MSDEIIYLVSPYTHKNPAVMQLRHDMVCQAAAYLIMRGHTVFCPVAHLHNISSFYPNAHHSVWMKQVLVFLSFCKKLIILKLPLWESSDGIHIELTRACELNIPIEYKTFEEIMSC